jgi:hypothetical protein
LTSHLRGGFPPCGGLAYGEVKINGTTTLSATVDTAGPIFLGTFSATDAFSHSQVNTGWVVGYGTEGHLPLMPGNWTWKVEGLWMDLGTLDATGPSSLSCSFPSCLIVAGAHVAGGGVATHSHFTDGILRGGLNYRF